MSDRQLARLPERTAAAAKTVQSATLAVEASSQCSPLIPSGPHDRTQHVAKQQSPGNGVAAASEMRPSKIHNIGVDRCHCGLSSWSWAMQHRDCSSRNDGEIAARLVQTEVVEGLAESHPDSGAQ